MADLPESIVDQQTDPRSAEGSAEAQSPWRRWGELAIAAVVVGLGIVVLLETQEIRFVPFVTVSPRLFPQLIGAGLILIGVWYGIEIIRNPSTEHGEESEDFDPEAKTDWSVIVIITVGLACYAALMEFAGFIIASAVLFFISAFAMGSRRFARDVAIALAIGIAIFLVFDTWLGVRLPAGELGEWITQQL